MALGEIIDRTFKQYWGNFRAHFGAMLLFYGLPLLLIGIFSSFWFYSGPYNDIMQLNENLKNKVADEGAVFNTLLTSFKDIFFQNLPVISLIFFLSILVYIVGFIPQAGLIASSLKSDKFKLSDIARNGKQNWGKMIWFTIVIAFIALLTFIVPIAIIIMALINATYILLVPGFLLLFILAILYSILIVYWSLSIFVYFESNLGVIGSLRKSMALVRGRWWLIVGYIIVMMLMLMVPGLFFGLFNSGVSAIIMLLGDSFGVLVFAAIVSYIINLLQNIIVIPFSLLFMKNIYQEFKSRK